MVQYPGEFNTEAYILNAVSQGAVADLRERQGRDKEVDGDFLRAIVLGLEPESCLLPAGLRIRGAIIRGSIDLRDCTALPPLVLEECQFEPGEGENCNLLERDPAPALDLSGASVASLSLKRSRFGLVRASGCIIDGDVDVSHVAPLRPDLASVFAESSCWLDFSGCRIAGLMFARNLDLRVPNWPEMRKFDLRQPRYALFLAASTIGGTLDLSGGKVRIDGGISLYLAKIGGDLWLGGCKLICNGGGALHAQGLCARAIFAERRPALRARGMVSLSDARIEHGIKLPGAVIVATLDKKQGTHNTAILANGLTTGSDLSLQKLFCKGSIRLDRAKIGGTVSLVGARLDGAGRDSLHAPGMEVMGSLLLSFGGARNRGKSRRFGAVGCVWLYSTSIGEHFDLRGASLMGSNPDTDPRGSDIQYVNALSATDLTVGDCVFIGSREKDVLSFDASGAVRIQRAHIAKDLEIVCAVIEPPAMPEKAHDDRAPANTAVDLGWTKIDGSLKLESNSIRGSINLSYTRAAILSDSLDGYPDLTAENGAFRFQFDGFEYQTIQSPALLPSKRPAAVVVSSNEVARSRFTWLERSGGKAHSYAVLARAFQRQALPDAARAVLRRQQKEEHRFPGWPQVIKHPGQALTNALMWCFGFAFGYGLSPFRATGTLLASWILGVTLFWWADDRGAMVIDQQPVAIAIGREKPVTIELTNPTQLLGARAASDVPCHNNMNPVLYALDVFIPLVDLREESKCDMGEATGARLYVGEEIIYKLMKTMYALLGWLVISLSILTYTGFIERRRVGEV